MSDKSLNWYVFSFLPHRHVIAVENLTNQDFEVFLPQVLKTVRHARKVATKIAPLFPGYGFVRFDIQTACWRRINNSRGVKRLITSNERPLPVPPSVIESLMEMSGEKSIVTFQTILQTGDSVRFSSGAFANRIGRLASLDGKGRVEVLLEILSGEIPVKAHVSNLVPV